MRLWHGALSALCLTLLVAVRPDVGAAPSQQPTVLDNVSVDELLASADALLLESKGNTAFPIFERALERAIQMSLEPQEAQARYGLARVLYYRTQYAAAREHTLKAAAIYERLSSQREYARAMVFLSALEELSGQFSDARAHAERAVAAYKSVDDPRGRASATLQLIRVGRFDVDTERPLYESAIADARAAGDIALEGRAHHPAPIARRSVARCTPLMTVSCEARALPGEPRPGLRRLDKGRGLRQSSMCSS